VANRHPVSDEIKAYNNPDTRARLLNESFSEVAKKSPDALMLPDQLPSRRPDYQPGVAPELIAKLRSAGIKKEAAKAQPVKA